MRRIWLAHLLGSLVLLALVTAIWTGYWRANAGWGFISFLLVVLAVGWFLAARLPANVLGWLMISVSALFAIHVPAGLIGQALLSSAPELASWLLWIAHDRADLDTWSWIPPVGIMLTQIPLHFPTGALPSPRWRWFSWSTIVVIVLAAAVQSTYTAEAFPGVPSPVHVDLVVGDVAGQFLVTPILIVWAVGGTLASLIVRYRRGDLVERAQIRWMLWATVLSMVALSVDAFAPLEWRILHEWILLVLALVPISIAVAVLRYHLYAIDRIISRTAVYAIVSVLIGGVYALVVVSVTWLLPGAPAVAVALATLAAAAVFLPALRWIRRRVDRRFDRARYDAERIVDDYGERLRTGVDPHTAAVDLATAVDEALQPAAIGLWTRAGS